MTQYLKNAWYAAAHAHEVTASPLARTLLDECIVLYRTGSNTVAALHDRCPHRFAPLSAGKVRGDELECGYHGLRFNSAGACSHNPHGPVPARAKVRSFPTVERFGVVWFWPGEAARADANLLPDFPFLADGETYSVMPGYLHVKSNYQLIVDNLLDLSHVVFVHPHFAPPGQTVEQQLAATITKTITQNNTVTSLRHRIGVPPNGPTQSIFGFGPELVDSRAHMHWYAPALIRFDLGSCLTGTPEKDGLCIPQAHLITPETEFTSHYFFAATWNLRRDDPHVRDQLRGVIELAFRDQDEPMIEAVQRRMGETSDLGSLNPLLLGSDAAPVAARRILERLIEAERAGSQFSAAG